MSGKNNSTLTRVTPVFDQIRDAISTPEGVRRLLSLPTGHRSAPPPETDDIGEVKCACWGKDEKALRPPVSLLSWLIRNLPEPQGGICGDGETARLRKKLLERDPETIQKALNLLRSENRDTAWYVLEGPSYPDVFIETEGVLIVIEGKRTEAGPTTHTTWMPCRHQMLRHLDGAWEVRGRRSVFGFFIVEGEETGAPAPWIQAAKQTVRDDVLRKSLPHRSDEEKAGITGAFLGVTTWRRVCSEFGVDLP